MCASNSLLRAITIVFILGLTVLALIPACDSGEKSTSKFDSLSDAQLLPNPTATIEEPVEPSASFINVVSSTVSTDFPESLTFALQAESSHQITDIELQYKIEKVTTLPLTTTIKPDFESANLVQTEWIWDTRKANLPPGARIEYKWVITNINNDELATESTPLAFNDSRYEWQELVEGHVHLYWYKGDLSFGEDLMAAAQAALEKLLQSTGAQLEKPAGIYVYANTQELHGALIYPQEWTGGLAFSDYGIIAIGISPSNMGWGKRVIAHELTHLVIHQITYNPLSDMPNWLSEGLAMYIEGEFTDQFRKSLEDAVSQNALFPVRSLSGRFPTDTDEAELAYAQSQSLVTYLIDNYGSEKMRLLLEVFKRGSSDDNALIEVYDFDIEGLENRWRESLGLEAPE